jgi:hypothetical protein
MAMGASLVLRQVLLVESGPTAKVSGQVAPSKPI